MKTLGQWFDEYLAQSYARGLSPIHLRVVRFHGLAFLRCTQMLGAPVIGLQARKVQGRLGLNGAC